MIINENIYKYSGLIKKLFIFDESIDISNIEIFDIIKSRYFVLFLYNPIDSSKLIDK
jgi:hypothetical protein